MSSEEKQVHVRVPEEIYKKLKVKCVYKDTSMQDYVATLISESLGEYSVAEQSDKKKAPRKPKRRR